MFKKTLIILIVLIESFAGFAQTSKNLNLLSNFTFPAVRGRLSDVWGHYNGVQEYALVGLFDGISIVDITDPVNPNEVFYVSDVGSVWKDMAVWNNHAYVSNETGGGLMIIDMSNLPGVISPTDVYFYTGNTYPFTTVHNVYIDENGVCYLLGSNNGVGGAIILDLTIDPQNPVELGRYDEFYLHDATIRGDTLWGGAVFDGFFTVTDVSDKANPITLATHTTPNAFTHNCWMSDDGSMLYTTDERSDAFIAAYNVSDLSNIAETDRIQSSPGNDVIPHNTHFINNYLVTSYYNDGVTIHDVSNPNNMIEVGHYDTAPLFSGSTSDGCWGAYPYLPSGVVLATDRDNGLFVLDPNYVRGSGLQGQVTSSVTNAPIGAASVEFVSSTITATTNLIGNYATGVADAGSYDIIYSSPGFASKTISGVVLSSGTTVTRDVELDPIISSTNDLTASDKLSIYPNPFKSEINIEIKDLTIKNISIEVSDVTGRVIDIREFQNTEKIYVSNKYKEGIYFISVYGDEKLISTKKLVKH